MNLVIVESPNKCKKIAGFLGSGWIVKASVGHIRDLPKKEMGVEAPNYRPKYVVSDTSKKTVSELKALAGKADKVFLATDLDREGEAIAWHLKDALKLKEYERITFQEITEKEVLHAIKNTRQLDMHLVGAQETRRVIDRLVGYKVSSVATQLCMLNTPMSAGRVQSPTLRILWDREAEIRSFKNKKYFELKAVFDQQGIPKWDALWDTSKLTAGNEDKHFTDEAAVREFEQAIEAEKRFKLVASKSEQKRQRPPAPFTTSSLQQAASVALALEPDQTMKIAQALFEQGLITYHRTDSVFIAEDVVEELRDIIRSVGAEKKMPTLLPAKPNVYQAKGNTQEAHEAIRPSNVKNTNPKGLNGNESSLYQLIAKRAVMSQMADCVNEHKEIKLVSGAKFKAENQPFLAKGKICIFEGWRIYGEDSTSETEGKKEHLQLLPSLEKGAIVVSNETEILAKKTKAPARYTKASLIKKLDKEGIGRPSTYAAILKNLEDRSYILSKSRKVHVTDKGETLVETLKPRFKFLEINFTRELERVLDEIARGNKKYINTVTAIDQIIDKEIKNSGYVPKAKPIETDVQCPKCKKKKLLERNGTNGVFWGCSGYPKCKYTTNQLEETN